MSSRCRAEAPKLLKRLPAAALVLGLAGVASAAGAAAPALRVCADPDNLPYSHRDGSGYENRLAVWLARELHRPLQVAWLPLQRGFTRKTLGEGHCDVLLGVPVGLERVATTRPYYRSGYVFVSRPLGGQPLRDFDDVRLKDLRIGVQLPGDGAATPPGQVLAQRGAVENVRGFEPLGVEPSAQRAVRALADGDLDAVVLWGPPAGWFARRAGVPLVLTPVRGEVAGAPFAFDMALAVRPGDTALRAALDAALGRLQPRIDALLAQYGVPLLAPAAGEGESR
ncbi:quinoprotein dehydrogenase-associated putative ABC transporter substrate-binding protein [Azohydromonas lata]|uniref:Quinoprotein dehydrogenase-associated putative ABC transporter substrate-binding protein n=1 Tax=Azohydromonas lata TaxID=45677 RepID=A0ABU5IGC3_9BURK|nr:quinoprotein dehydrogenase-associated putative ABC transporter substrate-binding protein [Azohydromonas lata]MDZ5458186.1 quinoprotein dehydrogenase-associated putative ABC transporter substrate-binding protein [Azohydromonas lata]